MKNNIAICLILIYSIWGCCNSKEFCNSENDLLSLFKHSEFATTPSIENIDKKYITTLKRNNNLDLKKMNTQLGNFNSTDIGYENNMKFLLFGFSKNVYFILYEKGGRLPVKILLIALNKNGSYREEYILYNDEISISSIKNCIEKGDYVNRYPPCK